MLDTTDIATRSTTDPAGALERPSVKRPPGHSR